MDSSSVKQLLHHCGDGQWFYYLSNQMVTGTFGFEKEDDKQSIPGNNPDSRKCRVCSKTTAEIELEWADVFLPLAHLSKRKF